MSRMTTTEEDLESERTGVKRGGVFYTEDATECEEEIECLFSDMLKAMKCSDANSDLIAGKFDSKANLKSTLAAWLERCCDVMGQCKEVIRAASNTVDKLKGEKIERQQSIIRLQDEVIKKQSEELKSVQSSVQSTVQTEMKSYCAAVKMSCTQAITPKKLKAVVREAVVRDDKGKNFMIFGMKEEAGEDLKEKVSVVLEHLGEKPHVSECYRVGREGTDKPVKITLRSSEAVHQILAKSGRLSKVDGHKSVYLSPDRSREEREVYSQLTKDMKQMIKDNSDRYYYIRNRKICHTDRLPKP